MSENKSRFIGDLIASIKNEQRTFDMSRWTVSGFAIGVPATCGTACCIAGHIEAIRPELAARMVPEDHVRVDHASLANAIYEHETGEECNLDFCGYNTDTELQDLTREDAVLHILNENPEWPQLTGEVDE